MKIINFPALFHLFGGYLNQDYDLEYGTWQNAIKSFLSDETPEIIVSTLGELNVLLGLGLKDDELNKLLFYELCCFYAPYCEGFTPSEWLHIVRKMFNEHNTTMEERKEDK